MKNLKLHKAKLQNTDDFFQLSGEQLGFFTKTLQMHQHTVFIDEPFVEPSYYRSVVQMLLDASEEDVVLLQINSPGGLMSGLTTLMEAVKSTEAHTVAVLVGECASAASMLTMYCDSVVVTESASMLCHNMSYSTGGKGSDILSHTQHVAKTCEKLMKDTYKNFLSPSEIQELLSGREIYLDSEEIQERLDLRDKKREQEILDSYKEELPESPEPLTLPKRKRK